MGAAGEVPGDELEHRLALEHLQRQEAGGVNKVAFDIDDAARLLQVKAWLIKGI